MTLQQVEVHVIAKVAGDYRQRGYDVDIQPSGANLPDFLGGFRPDLIARRPGDNVVVEVKIGTRTSVADRLREVTERVSQERVGGSPLSSRILIDPTSSPTPRRPHCPFSSSVCRTPSACSPLVKGKRHFYYCGVLAPRRRRSWVERFARCGVASTRTLPDSRSCSRMVAAIRSTSKSCARPIRSRSLWRFSMMESRRFMTASSQVAPQACR